MDETAIHGKWPKDIKAAVLEVASLAFAAMTVTRSWAANSPIARVRQAAKLNRAEQEIAQLREQIRISDARMARIEPRRRPHYIPPERLSILALMASRGWSATQTAQVFGLDADTVSSWIKRAGDDDDDLLCLRSPVNKYPTFVTYIVQHLKATCPLMGKRRIAQVLTRQGLTICASTVGRMIRRPPAKRPGTTPPIRDTLETKFRQVTSKYPNHLWHVDLTVIPTESGRRISWFPFSLPQVWPFVWHVAFVVDNFSRAAIGFCVFKKEPTARDMTDALGKAIHRTGKAPPHLVSDKGAQFDSKHFREWCQERNISQRYGAIGRHGSIAVIERFIRSSKQECMQRVTVPMATTEVRKELQFYVRWYNHARPHQTVSDQTPAEAYQSRSRAGPPRPLRTGDNCDIDPYEVEIAYLHGRRHLPIVTLHRAVELRRRKRNASTPAMRTRKGSQKPHLQCS